jgi:hypothetical protein
MRTRRLFYLVVISLLVAATVVALKRRTTPIKLSSAQTQDRESAIKTDEATPLNLSPAQPEENNGYSKSGGDRKSKGSETELLRLATQSDFAFLGNLVGQTGIAKRFSNDELLKLDDLSKTFGGIVYIFEVEEVVIKGTDFGIDANQPAFADHDVRVFKRQGSPYSPNELYVKGKRYLVFVSEIPDQAKLMTDYKLEEKKTYYQAFDIDKGIVQIENKTEPFLLKLKQLGDAVKPLDPQVKLQRLKALSKSRDAELKESARAATSLIQQNFHQ